MDELFRAINDLGGGSILLITTVLGLLAGAALWSLSRIFMSRAGGKKLLRASVDQFPAIEKALAGIQADADGIRRTAEGNRAHLEQLMRQLQRVESRTEEIDRHGTTALARVAESVETVRVDYARIDERLRAIVDAVQGVRREIREGR